MMIPAGGAVRVRRDNRLMKLAMRAAGRSLMSAEPRTQPYGEARKVSRRRKNRARYLTCKTLASSRPYSRL